MICNPNFGRHFFRIQIDFKYAGRGGGHASEEVKDFCGNREQEKK